MNNNKVVIAIGSIIIVLLVILIVFLFANMSRPQKVSIQLDASNLMTDMSEAKIAKAKGDLRVLKIATEAYIAKHNSVPANLDSIAKENTVISRLPDDPFNTSNNTYGYTSNGKYYAIWSIGTAEQTTSCKIDARGNIIIGGENQIGTTNGTPPNLNWR